MWKISPLRRLKSLKAQAMVLATISVALLGAISFGGTNLLNHLQEQDELLTSGLNRSERGLTQLDREVLRLSVLVKDSSLPSDSKAIQRQINLVESRLGVIRKHHISTDLSPQLAATLGKLDDHWNGLQKDLDRWLAEPKNTAYQQKLFEKLVAFELLINDLSNKHSHQRRDQYVQLVELRSGAIQLISMIAILFLLFIGIIALNTARFIRERQRILSIIREQEAQYRRIIETSAEGIWLLDQVGQTTFANHQMAAFLGITDTDMAEAKLWDFLPSQDAVSAAQRYISQIRGGARSHHDLQLLRQDGEQLWMQTNATPILDENGHHQGTLCMLSDVTLRRKSEEALKDAKQMAEVANEAKSEFLANMSHELRTPLNGILGYAQILGRSENLGHREQHGVQIIHQCGSHLLALINDILELSKIEARKLELNPQTVNFREFLQGVVEICRVRADKKGLEFIYHPQGELPLGVLLDDKRLRQVLINLLGNAIKFTSEGLVRFHVERLNHREEALEQPACESQASIRFAIQDSGVGLAPDDLAQIFQPFEQVGDKAQRSQGTGLGLAISQRIVELMGGQIQVESQLGQGSVFSFEVPLAIAQIDSGAEEQANLPVIVGYVGPRRRLLLVDNLWENRSVLVELLTPLGFELTEVENGQQAIKQLRNGHFDLVITDMVMPVVDGLTLLKTIRQEPVWQSLPVIIASASVTEVDRQMAIQAGSDYFLTKPIQFEELLNQLVQLLQLEWNYGGEDLKATPPLLSAAEVPDLDFLQALFSLTQTGRLQRVTKLVEQLELQEPKYAAFAQQVAQLARDFKTEMLEDLLVEAMA